MRADLSGKNPYSSWTVSYLEEELVQQLLSKGYAAGSGIDSLELTYSELGNVIQVKVFYENGQSNTLKPEKIRSAFGVPSIPLYRQRKGRPAPEARAEAAGCPSAAAERWTPGRTISSSAAAGPSPRYPVRSCIPFPAPAPSGRWRGRGGRLPGRPLRHSGNGERRKLYLPGLRKRASAGPEPVRRVGHGGARLFL